MSFRRGEHTKNKYNALFQEYGLHTRVAEWTQCAVALNNGVILNGSEIRKFRSRVKSNTLLGHIDGIYKNKKQRDRDCYTSNLQKQNARLQNKKYWAGLDNDTKLKRIDHMRHIQGLVDRVNVVHPTPWNKGLTKHDDDRIRQLSVQRTGAGNPMYGTHMSDAEKQRRSFLLKEKIKSGEWTPHIHNSRTHWESRCNDKKFRSSWEAIYYALNQHDLYEDVRIEYQFDSMAKIYIVDFVNHQYKTLTEIKPSEYEDTEQNRAKFKAAREWCDRHGYEFRVLNQQYFVDVYDNIPFDILHINNIDQKLRTIKNEANKTN